jgi:four helix bundle protein
MKENIIRDKTFNFALRIVKLSKFLSEERNEYILSKQILRSGTSIGANIEETIWGLSEKEFIYKLSISYREARETLYWLRLLEGGEYISHEQFISLSEDCEEILKIIWSIQSTMKKKMKEI